MDKKTISIISYITIIGWLIAYFSNSEKTSLAKFHLKQSFGLFLFTVIVGILIGVVTSFVPAIAIIDNIYSLLVLILIILGIINASKEEEKPLPIIGSMFVDKFAFIT